LELNEYMEQIPLARKARFASIRKLITSMYPQAEETMKYKMPTYHQGKGWVALANQKNYISLYTCSAEHLENFKKKYPGIKTGKGCINFRDRDEIPLNDLGSVIESAMLNKRHLKS